MKKNKQKNAFNFGSVKLQPINSKPKPKSKKNIEPINELYIKNKNKHSIDYRALEPYLDENVPQLSHRNKKRVYFQLNDDYEGFVKVNEDEILEPDLDTDVGAALSTCLNSIGNKIIMSRDNLKTKDQNPDENFIKYNNFLYI